MTIHLIARDLYRLIREVGDLERRLADAPADKKEALKDALRKKKAEREEMRNFLEGSKGDPLTGRRNFRGPQ